jgi:hypothetical protein
LSIVAALLHANGCKDSRFPDPLAPSQIGVLYPWMPNQESPLMDEFLKGLRALAPAVRLHGEDRCRVDEPGVKVQTIHGSKGLQYRAVILLWADRLPRSFPDLDPAEDPKLMYVRPDAARGLPVHHPLRAVQLHRPDSAIREGGCVLRGAWVLPAGIHDDSA